MLVSGCGDLYLSLLPLCHRSGGRALRCMEHPTECGLLLFEKQEAMK